ncbi:MAG: tetratricopeptide repeat protein, partial [Kiritimatiellae bacterium]|nr:tetratricopeptide repeat protein [Kiritimatiellia bacterium]
VRPFSDILPIPPEATDPAQQEAYEKVIEKARKDDVSVTPQNALLYHGLMLLQDEEYEECIPFLEEAIRRDPAIQSAWEGLGWAYIKTDRLDDADRLWHYFERLMPDQALPYSLLAQLYIIKRDWRTADTNFRKSLTIKPDQFDVNYWFAQNLMRMGLVDDAETIFRNLYGIEPDRLDIAIDLAALLTQRLQYEEAEEILRQVNDAIPDNPRFMLDQADLDLRIGELETANDLCVAVLAIDPTNDRAMRMRADIAEIAGMSDPDLVLKVIEETDDPLTRASLRIRLANRCHLQNERSPGLYETGFILGLIHDAIEDDPTDVGSRLLYGERLLQAGHLEEAHRQAVEVLVNFNPNNTRAKMLLFNIALRERRYDDAEQIITDSFAHFQGNSPMIHYHLANLNMARGRFREALADIDELEKAASKGTVLTLVYHDLTESDWVPTVSVRRLHEHLTALQREGWTLISPADIPEHVSPTARAVDTDAFADPPATARFFDWLRYCVTGTRRFPPKDSSESAIPVPHKLVAVTFDDNLRSSLALGTEVAADFGVPFGIFAPTDPPKDYTPSMATWEELREAAESGHWVVGSELHNSYIKKPVDADGLDIRAPLPNRVWLPKRNRLESMNEWDRRIRKEFRESDRILRRELGDLYPTASGPMVAYPYGDIGQEAACNLNPAKSACSSILAECGRTYSLGFVPSPDGYTLAGDNLLLCSRFEPTWTTEGSDIVRHAYEFHPAFLARALRARLAMAMDRPNLALEMLAVLRRDGYPEVLCKQLENDIHTHFQNRPALEVRELVVPAGSETVQTTNDLVVLTGTTYAVEEGPIPSEEFEFDPYLAVSADQSKANDQIETLGVSGAASVNLPADWTVGAQVRQSRLKQVVRPYWNAVYITNVTYEQSQYTFKSEQTEALLRLSHKTDSGLVLSGQIGVVSRKQEQNPNITTNFNLQDGLNSHTFDPADDANHLVGSVSAFWHPLEALSLLLLYDHNLVPSAAKDILYHSAAVRARWLPTDHWALESRAQYWSYDDDNAMYSAFGQSLWEISPSMGVWAGGYFSTVSTSDGCDYYWTPYWDERAMGLLRYHQAWEGFTMDFDFLAGWARSEGRGSQLYESEEEEEKDVMVDGIANTVTETKTVYVPRDDTGSNWHLSWGFSGKLEKRLNSIFAVDLEGNVVALREYIDHAVLLSLSAQF